MPDGVDLSALRGKTGLIKRSVISSDSEETDMRSVDEIIKLDEYLNRKAQDCDSKTNAMRAMFNFRGVPRNYVP
jgi:hypothetical protein